MEEGVVYAARNCRQEPRGCHRQVVLRAGGPALAQVNNFKPNQYAHNLHCYDTPAIRAPPCLNLCSHYNNSYTRKWCSCLLHVLLVGVVSHQVVVPYASIFWFMTTPFC